MASANTTPAADALVMVIALNASLAEVIVCRADPLRTNVDDPSVRSPPVKLMSPETLTVEGAVNVPAETVRFFNVSVVVDPPQDNARPVLFIMMLLNV